MMLQLNDEYLWDYNVDVVVVVQVVGWCCHCCWCRQVVDVVRCCWLSCCVHAYSYNVGGSCPVNVNHSKHVDFRILCSSVDFRSLCSSIDFRSLCSSVELRAYALTRWLVPHAYYIVKLLLCRCIVINVELSSSLLNSCCWFKC